MPHEWSRPAHESRRIRARRTGTFSPSCAPAVRSLEPRRRSVYGLASGVNPAEVAFPRRKAQWHETSSFDSPTVAGAAPDFAARALPASRFTRRRSPADSCTRRLVCLRCLARSMSRACSSRRIMPIDGRGAAHLTVASICGNVMPHDEFPSRGFKGNSGSRPGLPSQLYAVCPAAKTTGPKAREGAARTSSRKPGDLLVVVAFR